MTEKATSSELPSGRSSVNRGVVGASYRRFTDPRSMVSVTRLAALVLVSLLAYFVFVVPTQLAILLLVTFVAFAALGLVPLALAKTIVWVLA